MNEGRNNYGRFTKGHPGFKPKGAASRKKKQQNRLLEQLLSILEKDLENDLTNLTPHQRMKFWLKLNSLLLPKPQRVPYQPDHEPDSEPEQKTPVKFTFEVVTSDRNDSTTPENQ